LFDVRTAHATFFLLHIYELSVRQRFHRIQARGAARRQGGKQ
jgi:hypothetical protein